MNEAKNNAASAANENKVKAWRYDFTTYAHKSADGGEVAERVSTEIVYAYNETEVDCGHYWDVGNGCLNVYTDDGLWVNYGDDNCDRWSGLNEVEDDLLSRIKNVGDYAEAEIVGTHGKDFDKVRITGIDVPHLSAERSAANSDLSPAQKMRVKFYGVPMMPQGSLIMTTPRSNYAVNERVVDLVSGIFADYISAKMSAKAEVGKSVEVRWHWDDYSADNASVGLTISAECEDDLRAAFEVLGVKNLSLMSVKMREGDDSGEKRVTADLTISKCYS